MILVREGCHRAAPFNGYSVGRQLKANEIQHAKQNARGKKERVCDRTLNHPTDLTQFVMSALAVSQQ
jgi:hypothetical protein